MANLTKLNQSNIKESNKTVTIYIYKQNYALKEYDIRMGMSFRRVLNCT